MSKISRLLLALCAWVVLAGNAFAVAPENGWWWNPTESGSGYAIERQGNSIFMAAFLYEASGAATWYATLLSLQPDGTYKGDMTRYVGGKSLLGTYKPATPTSVVATATASFTKPDAGSMTITFPNGAANRNIPISRFAFASPSFEPSKGSFQSGWWWNDQESGTGYFIEVQGSSAFIASFMYDTTGQPTWYASLSSLTGTNVLYGALDMYANGQALGGAYKAPTANAGGAGSMSYGFTTDSIGNMTLPNAAKVAIKRFAFDASSVSNHPPVPNAGPNQTVTVGDTVNLSGTGTDADGDALTFSWRLLSVPTGSTTTLNAWSTSKANFVADVVGTYRLELIADDGKVSNGGSVITVTANTKATANVAPVANAGPNQYVSVGVTVNLNGSASSDANGDPLTYSWILISKPTGSTATLASSTTVSPTFTADVVGTYMVGLIVNDGKAESNQYIIAVISSTQDNSPTIKITINSPSDVVNPPISITWNTTNTSSCFFSDAPNTALPSNGTIIKSFINLLDSTLNITCIGAKGNTVTSNYITAPDFDPVASIKNGKFRLARLDYRYDTPSSEFNFSGYQTTSFEAVKIIVDRIKKIGFNGVALEMQAPINSSTGLIGLRDQSNVIKDIPRDTWRVIDYIKSQGLYIWIGIQAVDSITDITPNFTFSNFSKQTLFNSWSNYSVALASIAQQHGVDGIFIDGSRLDTAENQNYWTEMTINLKKVFNGKLALSTYHDSPVISMFDYIDFMLLSALSNVPNYDLATVVSYYNRDANNYNQIQPLRDISLKYSKKLILTLGSQAADIGVNLSPPNFWDAIQTNNFTTPTTALIPLSTRMKVLKIQAFLEMVGMQLYDFADGVTFLEFAPWLEDIKFSNPKSSVYIYYADGWNLTEDLNSQKLLNSYFSKPWGYHSLP